MFILVWHYEVSMTSTGLLNDVDRHHLDWITSNLVPFLLLSSNNRVSSFCWTRGSKPCFPTCFSYFSCYFLKSSIFAKSLLTSFFMPFLAARKSKFSSCFLIPLALWGTMSYVRPHVSGTRYTFSQKQDACKNPVVDSLLVVFPFSTFLWRFLMQTFVWQLRIIPFLLTKILKLSLSHVT